MRGDPTERPPAIGVLGLGEAGGLISAYRRAAGATVRGFDPPPETDPDAPSAEAAARGADVVLSLTTTAEARAAAESVLGVLCPGQVYADANTGSLAAVAIEALAAASAAGCGDWMHDELVAMLDGADADALDRMVTGSRRHAERRAHEMADVAALLHELGVEPRVSDAARGWLEQLRDSP